ncbi:sugar phosphate isomerase/epimerase [bacterium]|nr:sugar phosphate isomerase/epimerase [bacterium]
MIKLGLCSVTFRKMSVDEVIRTARDTGLQAIEWGGDVHVKPSLGAEGIRQIAARCAAAGLATPSYGSYFNVYEHEPAAFMPVLEAAATLGAKVIRVWAGWIEAVELTGEQLAKIAANTRDIADLAAARKVKVAFEFHNNTPTHGGDHALKLLRAIDHPNVFSYWQVLPFDSYEKSLDNLVKVLPYLAMVHMQNPQGMDDLGPLADREKDWRGYIGKLKEAGWKGCMFFEFNLDNSPAQLAKDAEFIQRMLEEV